MATSSEMPLVPAASVSTTTSPQLKPKVMVFCRSSTVGDFQQLLASLAVQPKFCERRIGTRIAKKMRLHLQPLNDSLDPIGNPFQALTRDFSEQGIGFIHPQPFPTEYLTVAPYLGCHSSSLVQVRYHHPSPEDGGVLIGVRFVASN